MRERIPDVTMLEVEHMPHNIADMVPQRCTDAILAFLGKKFGHPKV
jgi:hypothetical protein